jgi:hypothetical protein
MSMSEDSDTDMGEPISIMRCEDAIDRGRY